VLPSIRKVYSNTSYGKTTATKRKTIAFQSKQVGGLEYKILIDA
jgi:hypothetical protein